jgi:hypothetical protein
MKEMEGSKLLWKNVTGEGSERLIENLKRELEERAEAGTLKQWVDEKMVGWIVSEHASYAKDLEKLTKNWGEICDKLQVPRRGILRVRNIGIATQNDKSCTLVAGLCELLTREGYVVKYYKHFVPCASCGNVMLGKSIQENLWGKGSFYKNCRDCEEKRRET